MFLKQQDRIKSTLVGVREAQRFEKVCPLISRHKMK